MGLFHLVGAAEWESAREGDVYRPASFAREGFIHFSTDRQLLASAEKWFGGRDDVLVVSVRQDRVGPELRFERVGSEDFPHLYAPLPLEAVVEVVAMHRGADGKFELPVEWRPWATYFVPRSG